MDEDARATRSARAGASASRATRPRCGSTRTSAPASPPPASSTTCRSSSTRRRRSSTTSAPKATLVAARRGRRGAASASGPTRASATASCQHDRERPILAPEALFLEAGGVLLGLAAPHAQLLACARAATKPRGQPLPDLASTAARPSRCSACRPRARRHRVLIVAESEGRRESLLELLRDSRIEPPSVASLASSGGDERFAIAVAPLARASSGATTPGDRVRHRDRAVRDAADDAPARARSRPATSTR